MDEFASTLDPFQHRKQKQRRPLPTLTIISHPNPMRMGDQSLLHSLAAGKISEISRVSPPFNPPGRAMGKPLGDPYLSREPILLQRDKDGLLLNCEKTRTHVMVGGQQVHGTTFFSDHELERGCLITLGERIVLLLHLTRKEDKRAACDFGFVGASDGMVTLREEIAKVGDLNTPVLLRGESGTGKELAAKAIHDCGRPGRPFVSVNMGAVTPSLAASELFGAVRGSFTGASRDQGGYFKAAQGGTLFLDEIGETPPEVQVMLLRALETGEISPVGAQQSIKINARLIAATDANLETKMKEESFKVPLFHRLAGYEIHLPPLRDRLEDFGSLFLFFARQELSQVMELERLEPVGPQEEPWLPPALVLRLLQYPWPGNIRQLRNAVRQLVIGCRKEPVLRFVPKLEEMLAQSAENNPSAPLARPDREPRRKPAEIGSEELVQALRANRWDIKSTAEALHISRGALYKLIEKTPELQKTTDLGVAEIQACLEEHRGDLDAAADAFRVSPRALRRRMTLLGMNPDQA